MRKPHRSEMCKVPKSDRKSISTAISPPLPKDRVTDMTGVDFAGPLFVKENGLMKKSYICLFTCAFIRAVHLELVTDMIVESFKLAFRRFVSRRGIPSTVYFDNAPTFVSASNDIPKEMIILIN